MTSWHETNNSDVMTKKAHLKKCQPETNGALLNSNSSTSFFDLKTSIPTPTILLRFRWLGR